ncbi:AAA family ATPase [Paenibacillus sp. 7541]|uniref:AAA family ATPase n=1 Tax=Paenibacillus sp. 7541 TaxID=2026236 RepID=UPI000BA7C5FA|nr:AAA family ATPase [Paenibacillus sp. 7541]PAK50732.1 OLD family endonuclease [Paenibacillus sp. 7541]
MRLVEARVQNYRSIIDTGWFSVEENKLILVGPNEAGKTAILQALQQLSSPEGVKELDELRDYPRSRYNDISTNKVQSSNITVVEGKFKIEETDNVDLPEGFGDCLYVLEKRMDNKLYHRLENSPPKVVYADISKDLKRLADHVDKPVDNELVEETTSFENKLSEITEDWVGTTIINETRAMLLDEWLELAFKRIDESNVTEEERFDRLKATVNSYKIEKQLLKVLGELVPTFVYFNNYARVKPLIHLEHLAQRIESNILDDFYYDYGNICLLKLLGFEARYLSDLGKAAANNLDGESWKKYRDQLDKRQYQLNAASVKLTTEINRVWMPDENRAEASRLRIIADGQYLKVVVEDEMGVEIELDQRSEGYQWLVSFFIIFFAEAEGKYKNAILLLDEPGLNLHALKQAEFRKTISRLGEANQTIYTTHSPFMVGANELDIVRVVEMVSREEGTKVHTTVTASDSNAILPLQEALGYDLAQQRNLVFEGLTDYWYIEAISEMLRNDNVVSLNDKIALIPAGTASKVIFYATILKSHNLKVAALFDSDPEGEQAAKQDNLIVLLKNTNIFQVKDFYQGSAKKVEVEDLLRDTLVVVAKEELGWDVMDIASSQPARPIADVFSSQIQDFSKYKLAKGFLRWARNNNAGALTGVEQEQWKAFIEKVNKALR